MTKGEADHLARLIIEKVSTNIYKYVDVNRISITQHANVLRFYAPQYVVKANLYLYFAG